MQTHIRITLPLIFFLFCFAARSEDSLDQQLRLLNSHDIASDTGSILDFLRRQQPSAKVGREVDELIRQLSSTKFSDRESATRKLADYGFAAKARLVEAAKSKDFETAWRSAKILKQLESDRSRWLHDSLVLAALQVLKCRKDAETVPVLLRTLPVLDDPQMQELASEGVWGSTDSTHAQLLRKTLADENPTVKAAVIVALEIALGEKAVAILSPYLRSGSTVLRLAAARALLDHRPQESINTLIELVADEHESVAWQADALLQLASGQRMELSGNLTLPEAWHAWSVRERTGAKLHLPLGRKRLDLTAGRNSLHENFTRQAKSLAKGYGSFLYEADNTGTARVMEGKLLIDGDNDEGDQRLYITSDRMIGRLQWPRSFEVRARLGGNEGNNFGWHVGVSIGRVKVLFHPGLSGGACRAETTDTHESIFGNEDMGFTPATDAIHEMWIQVTKNDNGAEFDVTVHDANSKTVFHRKFIASKQQLGKFNRIGLERSGRRGADAVFDSVSIELSR